LLSNKGGYVEDSLNVLKHFANTVTPNQVAGRESIITLPNTQEHQDQLMKVASTGQYFSITRGGALMTSAAMILALEHKQMQAKAVKLQKKKDKMAAFLKVAKAAKCILSSGKNCCNYNKKDLETLIKWKQGPFPREALSKQDKNGLLALWIKYKKKETPDYKWMDQHEAQLRHLKNGEVDRLKDCESIQRALETQKDFLATRLGIIPLSHQIDVYNRHLTSLLPEQREEVISKISSLDYDESQGSNAIVSSGNLTNSPDEVDDFGTVSDVEKRNENDDDDESSIDYSITSSDEDNNGYADDSGSESERSCDDLVPEEISVEPLPSIATLRKKSSHTNYELRCLQMMSTGTRNHRKEGLHILDVEALRQNIVERGEMPASHDKSNLVPQVCLGKHHFTL
jgi:hypothetical protein